jgi:hypothetical protein
MVNGNATRDGDKDRGAGEIARQDDDPHFRADLVARIRREIAEGTYGTEEQLELALDRLLERLEQ